MHHASETWGTSRYLRWKHDIEVYPQFLAGAVVHSHGLLFLLRLRKFGQVGAATTPATGRRSTHHRKVPRDLGYGHDEHKRRRAYGHCNGRETPEGEHGTWPWL